MAVGEVTAGLLGAPLIMREQGSGTRASREEFFQWQPVELSVAKEADSHEIIKQAVMAGMGLSFLSLHTLGLELDNGLLRIIPVEGAPVVRRWNCVHTWPRCCRQPLSPFATLCWSVERGGFLPANKTSSIVNISKCFYFCARQFYFIRSQI